MNPIQEIEIRLRERFPDTQFHLTPPANAGVYWVLDVYRKFNQVELVIDWDQEVSRFSLCLFGPHVEEFYPTQGDAFSRASELLQGDA